MRISPFSDIPFRCDAFHGDIVAFLANALMEKYRCFIDLEVQDLKNIILMNPQLVSKVCPHESKKVNLAFRLQAVVFHTQSKFQDLSLSIGIAPILCDKDPAISVLSIS